MNQIWTDIECYLFIVPVTDYSFTIYHVPTYQIININGTYNTRTASSLLGPVHVKCQPYFPCILEPVTNNTTTTR